MADQARQEFLGQGGHGLIGHVPFFRSREHLLEKRGRAILQRLAVVAHARKEFEAGAGAGTTPPFQGRGLGELVLVVDDEPSIRELLVAILGRSGYRVLAAAHGAEALALYRPRAAEIALVITDLDMPVLDGSKLAEALQRLNPAVKLLFISGAGGASTVAPIPAGKLFLGKPFTREALLAAIREVLGSPAV